MTDRRSTLFPRRLSDTGLFKSVAEHQVADGVIDYSINAEQWSDYATAERFLAVPGTEPIKLNARPKQMAHSMFSRTMEFPLDTVLVKTLSLEMVQGDPKSRKRIETQTLHFDGREWQAYTYEWNDAQTDATLVDKTGKSRTFQVTDPQSPGVKTDSTLDVRVADGVHSVSQSVVRIHASVSPFRKSTDLINTVALADNQIRTLRHIGLFEDVVS